MSVYSFGETTALADCPSAARLQPQPSMAGETHTTVLTGPSRSPEHFPPAHRLDSLLIYYINGLLSVCSRRGGTFIWFTHRSLLHTHLCSILREEHSVAKVGNEDMRAGGMTPGRREL